jgi:hypothetical protein
MALGQDHIDAGSFTSIRIISGAMTLGLIVLIRGHRVKIAADWPAVAALFCYMVFFSFAYLSLSAGTGALLLFGAVQLTMFVSAIRQAERFSRLSWTGLGAAFAGLVWLVAPGVSAPDPGGASMMTIAGVAWGVYSLIGRRSGQPLLATTANFLYWHAACRRLCTDNRGNLDRAGTAIVASQGSCQASRRVGRANLTEHRPGRRTRRPAVPHDAAGRRGGLPGGIKEPRRLAGFNGASFRLSGYDQLALDGAADRA